MKARISSFTVLLLMAVFSVVGISVLPLLNVQYAPSPKVRTITVSYSWPDAAASVIESEVTSKLEGVFASIKSNVGLSSVSDNGYGSIEINFRKGTDMEAARFEVSSQIRNLYNSLPSGVSYPEISSGPSGMQEQTALSYVIKGDIPTAEIEKYITGHVMDKISAVEGTGKISLWGAVPFEWVVDFDNEKAALYGIDADELASAFISYFSTEVIGLASGKDGMMNVRLKNRISDDGFGAIPIKKSAGRIIYLRDVAYYTYQEARPDSYFRINGLNTIVLSINAEPNTNLIKVAGNVKSLMNELQQEFPDTITATLDYDSSEYISSELNKIYFRTVLCLLILMVFVFLVSRSWRYVAIISATLAVNIFIAVAMYYFLGLGIHIYTLAGITVSLGIIIDSSIVMTDHYGYYRNRKVFPALLGAVATTVAALSVIFLLPEKDKINLGDFALVISINLCVSLFTAYLFVPSLMDRYPLPRREKTRKSIRRLRRVVRFNRLYSRYIDFGIGHKWLLILLLIVAFGIPLFMLPSKIVKPYGEELSKGEQLYNKIISWSPYASNRNVIDKILGSSFGLFSESVKNNNFFREPGRKVLYIRAGMPEGCTVGQLNEVMKSMENYLSGFDEIESYITQISSPEYGIIEVRIKPEYEKEGFGGWLQSQATAMAIHFGGANWRVWGVTENFFDNEVVTDYRSSRISVSGYNYEQVMAYADSIMGYMRQNRRVDDLALMSTHDYSFRHEYNMVYDNARMALAGVEPYSYYSALSSMLYDMDVASLMHKGEMTNVVLRSSDSKSFDLWHVNNVPVHVDSSSVKLSDVGAINKEKTGLSIYKKDQSYEFYIGYNFSGNYKLSTDYMKEVLEYANSSILPIGFKASHPEYYWSDQSQKHYIALIGLIILIIYVMCSMIFESLRQPFAIIFMIPVSFIGVFLTFGLGNFPFDQGGFAAFVMLSGVVVNAGIYMVNAMRQDKRRYSYTKRYIRAFSHKINPIMMTIVSTVLGLVPFLFDGPSEVFWFAFAVGTIGGMFFSIIALIFYLPVFCSPRKRKIIV